MLDRNRDGSGLVNEGCGAEFVQKGQLPPCGVDAVIDQGRLLVSFDGDADRIVFHKFKKDGSWTLYDGDKIASLASLVIATELEEAQLVSEFSIGCVQTAYANGASTAFLRSKNIPVTFAKTGVKFLHHKAEEFDVGIYFEANGHGTVLFSERVIERLKAMQVSGLTSDRKALAVRRLLGCVNVVNQAVGDALSDMLLSLASMKVMNFLNFS